MKLTKLTKKQEKNMLKVRDKWINQFNSLQFDEQLSKDFVDWLYTLAGYKKPIKVILDSPLALQYACNMDEESQLYSQVESQIKSQLYSQVDSQVWSQAMSQVDFQVWSQVRSQLNSQVWSQVMSQVDLQVRSQVEPQVYFQVLSQVRSQVEPQVYSQVLSQVRSQVWSHVYSQVLSQVYSQVDSRVRSQKLKHYTETHYGRCDDSDWCSLYDFFLQEGIVHHKLFSQYVQFMKSGLFTAIFQDNIAYISKPPVFLNRDSEGRMHCMDDYAIYFSDGFGLHYIHGVYINPETFEKIKNKTITGEDIISLRNAEQKAALIQEFGLEFVFDSLHSKKQLDKQIRAFNKDISKEVCYELFEVNINEGRAQELSNSSEIENEQVIKAHVLKVEWYEQGRKRQTVLGVPNTITDAIEAVAWTCYTTKDKWEEKLLMEA